MMRRLIVVLVLLVCLMLPASVMAAKSYVAERYDVSLKLQAGGTLQVTETVIFRFSGGPFTTVFRDLAYTALDEIDALAVYMDGKRLAQGTGEGQVEVVAGRPLKVTWHFAPASDAAHEFVLVYQVQGAVRKLAGSDTLIWRAIPEEHDYVIQSSRISLEYPAGVAPTTTPQLKGAAGQVESQAGGIAFRARNIGSDDNVDIQADFPLGSLIASAPQWQARQSDQQREVAGALPAGLLAAALTALLGIAGALRVRRANQRDDTPTADSIARPTRPPSAEAPGTVAALVDGQQAAIATIFDLARRGVLSIEPAGSHWGSKAFTLVRQMSQEPLAPHESALVQTVFGTGKKERDRVSLTDAANALAGNSGAFNKALEEELSSNGWVDAERNQLRNRTMMWSVVAFIAGTVLFIAGAIWGGMAQGNDGSVLVPAVLLGAGVGLSIAGVIALIAGASLSKLSREGERQAIMWRGFKGFLADVARGREVTLEPDAFGQYLAYALALGVGEQWAKYYAKRTDTPVPAWLGSLQAADVSGVTAAIVAANAAGSSAASAGGASGGGASGAH